MKKLFTHDQLASLAELELTPEEEWSELYREWKKHEIEELWRELKRIEEIRLRKMQNRRNHIEHLLGVKLKVRVPRQLLQVPPSVAENN